ncbi:deoxycytidine deaminase [Gemmiger sp. An50]|uniref:dCTP deaminase domain-containing protein n=1 Tax=Gemmiger sp. An50 TaxID=1965639 RepID=UPI00111DC6A4|nr:deoxycytidine deaminase [Gemmiger sp. An50]
MLSRRDIEKEIGKGLCFYPLKPSNIKENSVNVTISKYAWCQSDATIYWYGKNKFSLSSSHGTIRKTLHYRKGQRIVFTDYHKGGHNSQYLLLLPHQTTIVETEEVIGIGNHIGGAVHSKVGVVAQGVGDTGTMLGPGYCGHLMISLHNITDDVIVLNVGDTFVSLTFDYLTTSVIRTSATVSSHYDRLLEHSCDMNSDDKDYFSQDWKSTFNSISEKMCSSAEFLEYKKTLQKNRFKEFRKYINKRNIFAVILVCIAFASLYGGALFLDTLGTDPVWVDRFWNVGCSGLIGSFLMWLWGFLKDKK